jgi:hypothetical protein
VRLLGVLAALWLVAHGTPAGAAGHGDPSERSPASAVQIGEGEVVGGLRLVIEHRRHRGGPPGAGSMHVHIRLVNEGRVPVRVFLGGDPFGAVPFDFLVDTGDPIPIAAEHRHEGQTVTRVLRPGKDYLVDLGPDAQFVGHTLTARYQADPDDCGTCWTGRVLSPGLWLSR